MWHKEKPIVFYPIGVIKNKFDETCQKSQLKTGQSQIILDSTLTRGLQGLEPGQSLMVLIHLNRVRDFELLQHPKGDQERPKRGVFSLRSPRRPNPIGVTVVKLISIDGNLLTVIGLDAFDGTPVLDLKPT
jgi:tRNA-Thr(GGU) m(6)t(6)A37 methyltransferase TsaA